MLFNKNDERANEIVLYQTKPNMILGCKKAIFGIFLLAVVFIVSPLVIRFIGEMQVYMISRIQLPLTRYAAIAFFVLILVIILYIIWQLIGWYSMEYTLTDSKIIIKSGVLSTKKNYMPYSTIQDINTSQGILARLFNVGTVSAFSAYDNNQIKLENISNPTKVEEIIFSNMMGYRSFQEPPRQRIGHSQNRRQLNRNYSRNDFYDEEEYYDEYEPITPIGHDGIQFQRGDYEYYPEEFSAEKRYPRYEYEPYGDNYDNLDYTTDRSGYENHANSFEDEIYYDKNRIDYSPEDNDYYHNRESEIYNDEFKDYAHQNKSDNVDESQNSSETVIRRHFDKFKK